MEIAYTELDAAYVWIHGADWVLWIHDDHPVFIQVQDRDTERSSMTEEGLPSMEPLAPLVDRLCEIAREEIPAPRTCEIQLYDDYTYRIYVSHSAGDGERQAIVYDRDSGNVYWRDMAGAREKITVEDPDRHEVSITTIFEDDAERVVTTIDPPL